MRRMVSVVLVAVVAGLAAAVAVAGGSAVAPSVSFDGPIVGLNADGGRAIVVTDEPECPHVLVWSPATGKTRLVFFTCQVWYPGVALAGDRAVWLMQSSGNNLYTDLFLTSLASGRKPRYPIASTVAGYSGERMTSVYGDGNLLVYDLLEWCQPDNADFPPDVPCPPGYKAGATTSEQLRLVLPERRVIASSGHDLTLLAVGGGRVVARLHTGGLIVLAPKPIRSPLVTHKDYKAEGLIATYPYAPGKALAAVTDGRSLAVLRGRMLDVIPLPGTKGTRTTRALPASPGGLRLVDLDGNIAVYIHRNAVYLLDLTTGRSVIVAKPTGWRAYAQLEPDGLYLAAGKTLTFMPRADVEQRLSR